MLLDIVLLSIWDITYPDQGEPTERGIRQIRESQEVQLGDLNYYNRYKKEGVSFARDERG